MAFALFFMNACRSNLRDMSWRDDSRVQPQIDVKMLARLGSVEERGREGRGGSAEV